MKVVIGIVIIIILVVFLSQIGRFTSWSWKGLFNSSSSPYYFNYAPQATSTPQATTTPPVSSGQSSQTINPEDIPRGFTLKQLSPYFNRVKIDSVIVQDPSQGIVYDTVVIKADLRESEAVNVSGWFLKANRGSFYIPRAVALYNPAAQPVEGDIVLRSQNTLKIFSTRGPFTFNLKINKCMGYLNNRFNTVPKFSDTCPQINRLDVSTFTGICQDYIFSLSTCQEPSRNPPVLVDDYACRQYLNSLDYPGCVNRNRRDPDFYNGEWWAWSGNRFLDPLHDRLLLFDKKALLVGEYIY